ncbi:pyridoxal 5'-phosphate synthase glutaminase subunit PdxT [bacterium CG17_big_fil_post_rev_8_21_14_2_50_64_8]|nr:MAG: pyridoxal 5'-phosphate synthase glutaminase subunit PdxT [bacterium CG17_big_fil_post_rev_8_21_14_2_50_64_8]PJA76420.1 MAG: pyridoxal 5'-phosphate synthase glutaminase subunit PdxT [bacterium CG_4_9_14_3_um_filter_65_15]
MTAPVGLLALQGDFEKHRQAFAALGRSTVRVRRPAELAAICGLVIPGGESTTLSRLIDRIGLREPLREFAAAHPVMGTCAGLIMLAAKMDGEDPTDFGVRPLGLLDCTVQRNGYGRQIDSFTAPVRTDGMLGKGEDFSAVFIRAPLIVEVGPLVEVVATHEGRPVAVRSGGLLGMTFHPELTSDLRIHQAFLDLV